MLGATLYFIYTSGLSTSNELLPITLGDFKWLIKLNLNNKVMLMYGIQLWGSAGNASIEQRVQSNVFSKTKVKYIQKLHNHPNPLAKQLFDVATHCRFRRANFPPSN